MSPATDSSGRLWTQERFLTRQVDKLETWRQERSFKGRVLGGHHIRSSSPRAVEQMREREILIMCVVPSIPILEGDCTFQHLKTAILSGFWGVKDNIEGV